MTVFCYDTEFIDDGHSIELISIGIVREDGKSYYAINSELRVGRASPWVVEHVIGPHLPIVSRCQQEGCWAHVEIDPTQSKYPRRIAQEVAVFLLGGGTKPVLWADYAAYDHVVLAQLFGSMSDLPTGIPMFTHELEQLWELADQPPKPNQVEETQHHALYDARYDLDLYLTCQRALGRS